MTVTVRVTKSFKTALKPLLKKYASLSKDLLRLEKELMTNPKLGTSLGNDCYKIRLKITSKSRGKSGGARIISLVEAALVGVAEINSDGGISVNLIFIYDKADTENVSDKELKDLIKGFKTSS